MRNLKAGLAACPPGQSGHIGSPHNDDLVQPWFEGRYFNVLFSYEAIKPKREEKMTLQPEYNFCKKKIA